MLQLNPPLFMETPKGSGVAHFVINAGIESHLIWVVFLDDSGECWSVANPYVRMQKNWTHGRPATSEIKHPDIKKTQV